MCVILCTYIKTQKTKSGSFILFLVQEMICKFLYGMLGMFEITFVLYVYIYLHIHICMYIYAIIFILILCFVKIPKNIYSLK